MVKTNLIFVDPVKLPISSQSPMMHPLSCNLANKVLQSYRHRLLIATPRCRDERMNEPDRVWQSGSRQSLAQKPRWRRVSNGRRTANGLSTSWRPWCVTIMIHKVQLCPSWIYHNTTHWQRCSLDTDNKHKQKDYHTKLLCVHYKYTKYY